MKIKQFAAALLCALTFSGCSAVDDTSSLIYQSDTGNSEISEVSDYGGSESLVSSSELETDDNSYDDSGDYISVESKETSEENKVEIKYTFRNQELYDSHYKKHGAEFGNITQEEYLEMANALIASDSPDILTKYEDDGDFMYFNTSTEEFLVLSSDGYIRTYFIPTDGIDYWNRQ